MNKPLAPDVLEQYVAFRERCDQFIQISTLWIAIEQGVFQPVQIGHYEKTDYTTTLRDLAVASLPTFVDKRPDSLNVFELLPEVFPLESVRIQRVAELLEPCLPALRAFRNKVVFHSDRSLTARNTAREAILLPSFGNAHSAFLQLCADLIRSESPVLEAQLRAVGYLPPKA